MLSGLLLQFQGSALRWINPRKWDSWHLTFWKWIGKDYPRKVPKTLASTLATFPSLNRQRSIKEFSSPESEVPLQSDHCCLRNVRLWCQKPTFGNYLFVESTVLRNCTLCLDCVIVICDCCINLFIFWNFFGIKFMTFKGLFYWLLAYTKVKDRYTIFPSVIPPFSCTFTEQQN